MRNESLLGFVIKILQRLATGLLMLRQIVVGSISDAFEFLPPKWKIIFDVISSFRVKRAFFIRDGQDMQLVTWNSDLPIKLQPLFLPVLKQLHPLLWPAKIFQLHLLKLARTKRKIARVNFVPE